MKSKLLRILADGRSHAVGELAIALGLPLADLLAWRADLLGYGLRESFPASSRCQWCLPGGLELLSEQDIVGRMDDLGRASFAHVTVLDSVSSTNDVARDHSLEAGSAAGRAWFAEEQRAGRGRLGRGWHSPFAANVYCTAVVAMAAHQAVAGYSLAVGVAAARAASKTGAHDLSLKWPNDILYQGRKVGGVLVDILSNDDLLVGIGLNVRMPASNGQAIHQDWTDLGSILGSTPSRNQIAADLLNELAAATWAYLRRGLAAVRDAWDALDCCRGRRVRVRHGNQWHMGTARGLDATGAMLVETEEGLLTCQSGEVSLRLAVDA